MLEKVYYFNERRYVQNENEPDEMKRSYWESLIGEFVCTWLQNNHSQFENYLKGREFLIESDTIKKDLINYLDNATETFCFLNEESSEITFANYYRILVGFAIKEMQRNLEGMSSCFDDTIYASFEDSCIKQLQKICTRTLIFKLHEKKEQGLLQGNSPAKEYEFFHEMMVGKSDFIKEMFFEFPVLYRCVIETIDSMVAFWTEFLECYQADFLQLQDKLGLAEHENKIIAVHTGLGDTHNHGRQVVQLELAGGRRLIYKPHSMRNEETYAKILHWLDINTGIKQLYYDFVSYTDHSWSEMIEHKSCKSEDELKDYYERFGAQLFLTWILGTKDLHFENLIAAGAYPVLVDLEMLLTNGEITEKYFWATEKVLQKFSDSVLMSGLLPYAHWNKGGEGLDCSALCSGEGQPYPFEIPGILDDKTSKMRIGYYRPCTLKAQNRATVNGIFFSPKRFEEQILSGFMKAYDAVQKNKKGLLDILNVIKNTQSRYLMTDTQRYSMLLNSSYHPSLLKDAAERELFLYAIRQGNEDIKQRITDAEVQCMLRGDIPLFFFEADKTDLYMNGDIATKGYFASSGYSKLIDKINNLTFSQIQLQCDYISVSLRMIKDDNIDCQNRGYLVDALEHVRPVDVITIKETCQQLLQKILDRAVWNESHTEVCWGTTYMSEKGDLSWYLTPMNMYLYDGLAGMYLILMYVQQCGYSMQVSEYCSTLQNMFFSYTDHTLKDETMLHSEMTGAYEGEGSILYLYILLYKMTGNEEFLVYAKKQAQIVGRLLEKDKKYDLLSGNAGAAYVFLMLYDLTADKTYLSMAEDAIKVVMPASQKQETGIGWILNDGDYAMSGMAHGNAGILMPVMKLLKITKNEKYESLAEDIWKYEDSLYNMQIGNWNDGPMSSQMELAIDSVAWCHGAAGILLSRMHCYELTESEVWKQRFCREMRNAYKKLKGYWKRDSWSLCHGNCGNLWILELAEHFFEKEGIMARTDSFVIEKMKQICFSDKITYLPQEILNPGLFNGYGGCLLYLLYLLNAEEC